MEGKTAGDRIRSKAKYNRKKGKASNHLKTMKKLETEEDTDNMSKERRKYGGMEQPDHKPAAPVIMDLTKMRNKVHETRGSKDARKLSTYKQVPEMIPEPVQNFPNRLITQKMKQQKKFLINCFF